MQNLISFVRKLFKFLLADLTVIFFIKLSKNMEIHSEPYGREHLTLVFRNGHYKNLHNF